jgi:hypothetical protein
MSQTIKEEENLDFFSRMTEKIAITVFGEHEVVRVQLESQHPTYTKSEIDLMVNAETIKRHGRIGK